MQNPEGEKVAVILYEAKVEPICSIPLAFQSGNYTEDEYEDFLDYIKLGKAKRTKHVAVVGSPDSPLFWDDFEAFLLKEKMRPCMHAPLYLLGLIAQIGKANLESSLFGKTIEACEPTNPASVFEWLCKGPFKEVKGKTPRESLCFCPNISLAVIYNAYYRGITLAGKLGNEMKKQYIGPKQAWLAERIP